MKKLIKVTSILGAVVMGVSATGVGVANAASITDNTGDTTAKVGLEKDPNAKVELVKAPDFDFGSQMIGSAPLALKATSVTDPIKVQNPGLTDGWNVSVKGTDFVTSDSTPLKLNGALLTLTGVVSSEDAENTNGKPTTSAVKISDADAPIFAASAGNGIGNWLNTYTANDDSATLDIPAGNQAGNYVSTLTWTLADAPK